MVQESQALEDWENLNYLPKQKERGRVETHGGYKAGQQRHSDDILDIQDGEPQIPDLLN